jgi:hypothetical protein
MALPAISEEATAPKSTHVADPTLQPFLKPAFDPADYLNATLPSLSLSSVSSRPLKQGQSASLADLSTQTQDLLSQLNAHTTRLSTLLTQLTDDILRSGGRLAYEVEVLRGETIGLTETLTEGLKGDVEKFLPGGVTLEATVEEDQEDVSRSPTEESQQQSEPGTGIEASKSEPADTTPDYISELRTLSTIRSRLESVIKIFGEAMHWTLPPSEVSIASSLISVSAPSDPSSGTNNTDLEKRGKEFAQSLRSEISDLITGSDNTQEGAEAAAVRIQALRDLAQVWKGTAEEKARIKFVDGLVKLAEEKQKAQENAWNQRQAQRSGRSASNAPKPTTQPTQQQKSGGFLDNLQRIRGNIGLE